MDTEKSINEDEEQTELFLDQEVADYHLKEALGQLLFLSRCAYESKELLESLVDWEIWQGMDEASRELIRISVDVCLSLIIKWSNFELRQKEGCTIYPLQF